MSQWLQQIPPDRLVLWIFLAGVAWGKLRDHTRSLRSQGARIGGIGKRVSAIEGRLGLTTPADPDEGDGR